MTRRFTASLSEFVDLTQENYVKIKRQTALDLFSAVVLDTPVDKGVLRNNWFVGIESSSQDTTDASDRSGTGTINRIKSELEGADLSDDVYLTNNLPYAAPIEFDGHSGKAPEGMVRVNTLRWDEMVTRNARRISRE